MKIEQIIPWIVIAGIIGYLVFFKQDSAYKEQSEIYKRERDQYMEASIANIKRADSLHIISTAMHKEVDSLKKVSLQFDIKLIQIKKLYEKRYTDVSNNTPTESYLLFTEYTDKGFSFPH